MFTRQPDQHAGQKILESNQIKRGYYKYHSSVSNSKTSSREISTISPAILEKDKIVMGKPWAQSLFCRIYFVRRRKTTGKALIPAGAQKEAELKFSYQIVGQVENCQIPASLIINFDQTPSKCVQVSSMALEKKGTTNGTTNVPISGVDDKRPITATFAITLDKTFSPMQLIYKRKTNQSLPKVNFPQPKRITEILDIILPIKCSKIFTYILADILLQPHFKS